MQRGFCHGLVGGVERYPQEDTPRMVAILVLRRVFVTCPLEPAQGSVETLPEGMSLVQRRLQRLELVLQILVGRWFVRHGSPVTFTQQPVTTTQESLSVVRTLPPERRHHPHGVVVGQNWRVVPAPVMRTDGGRERRRPARPVRRRCAGSTESHEHSIQAPRATCVRLTRGDYGLTRPSRTKSARRAPTARSLENTALMASRSLPVSRSGRSRPSAVDPPLIVCIGPAPALRATYPDFIADTKKLPVRFGRE